ATTGGAGQNDGARCYRTGDLAARRRDGVLEFRGRKDFQIKFNGVRVELSDIEAALSAHDTVAECAVVAITTSDRLVSRLIGYVVPRRDEAGASIGSAAAWRSALRARFGKAMPPVSFHTMIGLPRGIGGKVDRRRLPEPAATPAGQVRQPDAPVRSAVAALWAGFPGVKPTGADESFFAAGGRSLQVPVLLERVRERFGVEVPLRDFLATPTIAGLSTLVESQRVSLTAATLRGEDRDTA
ncbi:MAG TPA: phosphopantetheine-binding protein, partial [Actinokineospora sp.]|nr:phosphopantetheine-binding protein [Actinokineospora sp.]